MNLYQKLMHKLFGFEYVAIRHGFRTEVRRVMQLSGGLKCVWIFSELIILSDTSRKVIWL